MNKSIKDKNADMKKELGYTYSHIKEIKYHYDFLDYIKSSKLSNIKKFLSNGMFNPSRNENEAVILSANINCIDSFTLLIQDKRINLMSYHNRILYHLIIDENYEFLNILINHKSFDFLKDKNSIKNKDKIELFSIFINYKEFKNDIFYWLNKNEENNLLELINIMQNIKTF